MPKLSFNGFIVDLDRGCLLNGEQEVKLRPKVFETLKYLVENRKRLVTKDELIKAIWADTFVTDDSLVQCLVELRRALGDEAQTYIKTVPKRGYILMADVRPVRIETASSGRSYGTAVVALATLAGAAAAVFLYRQLATTPAQLSDRDTLLIADFVNTTGDDVFDGTLRQALAVQLGQAPFLNIFSDERIRETLRYMDRPPNALVTAHVSLARAAAIAGDTEKSRQAYESFFAIWRDADADIPVLVAAKKEYQKLRRARAEGRRHRPDTGCASMRAREAGVRDIRISRFSAGGKFYYWAFKTEPWREGESGEPWMVEPSLRRPLTRSNCG
jgi:DNA-binding winged helix-turn-helix (wHTH) protein